MRRSERLREVRDEKRQKVTDTEEQKERPGDVILQKATQRRQQDEEGAGVIVIGDTKEGRDSVSVSIGRSCKRRRETTEIAV